MRNYESIEHFVNMIKEGRYRYENGSLISSIHNRPVGSKGSKGNYLKVRTTKNRKRMEASVHCVVFAYFHGIEELKKHETIDHVDGDKYNNRIENLEGVSDLENNARYNKNQLDSEKARHVKQMLSEGHSMASTARLFGVSTTTIAYIRDGLRWKNA